VRLFDGDVLFSLRSSPVVAMAAIVTIVICGAALFAPWIAPQNPYDVMAINPGDAFLPPGLIEAHLRYPLGTDNEGRDILSAMLYGSRVSLLIGFASIGLAMIIGVVLGLLSGYVGGAVDAAIMRLADVQLSFPAILTTMLIDGILRGALGRETHARFVLVILVVAIALSLWVQFARTVRAVALVERDKDYVLAARVIGMPGWLIMLRHVLPNVMGPTMVIATVNLSVAIITEATLSFLGVGVPPTQTSLWNLVRGGNDFLFSGEWWIVVFPGAALALIVFAVNLLGDWMRDVLDPKIRSRL